MEESNKGTAFVVALAKLAQEHGVRPDHAMQCFGQIAGMMTDFEIQRGRVASREEGTTYLLNEFARGINDWFKRHPTDDKKH